MVSNLRSCHLYTEQDAAEFLGVSISRLYSLLDAHIFNDGSPRPANLTFTNSDLVLLRFWLNGETRSNVVRMPRRS